MPVRARLPALLLTLALCLPVAIGGPPGSHAGEGAEPLTRPLLWKVSDADNAVYLLGSFHLLKPGDYPLPAEVDRAFADADALVFEVHPSQMAPEVAGPVMQKYMAYNVPGASLSTVVPKPTLDKLARLLAASGGSLQAVERTEPWLLTLGMVLGTTRQLGFRQELGLDVHLMERAAKAGKQVSGLETLDDQVRAMDAVPYPEQVQGLDEFVSDPAEVATQLAELHEAWRRGDVAALDDVMREEMQDKAPQSYRLINVERNRAWLPQIQAMLDAPGRDDTLVVVGALHLLGEDGLVQQLRAKGYAVERICDACD